MVENTMSAKNVILRRIRNAIGQQPEAPAPAREYRQTPTLNEADRLALFASRLEDYNAGVYRCDESALPETIAHVMETRSKVSLLIPAALPPNWLPAGLSFPRDEALDYNAFDQSEGALTACTVAIAMTGTIILSHFRHEGRRALSLIPDYHLCIVRADQIVETVPEGIRALRNYRTNPITTISGPSATADIEMIRVKGVHGPRTLDVIITGGPA